MRIFKGLNGQIIRSGGEGMTRKTSDGKYIPVVYDKGFVDMVELKDGKWKVVECDTLEEAEQKEKEYKEFWKTERLD